jgi:hypothetical protein
MTRLEALLSAFRWHGGTIHQVAETTGCTASDLLHAEADKGWHCTAYHFGNINGDNAATHGTHRFLDPQTGKAFPHTFGRLNYWLGVADGYRAAVKEVA